MNSQEEIGRFPYKINRTNKKLNNQIKGLNQNKKILEKQVKDFRWGKSLEIKFYSDIKNF